MRGVPAGPALVAALAIIALPLVGSPRFASPAPWLSVLAGALLLTSRAAPDRRAASSRTPRERLSALAIFASTIAVQMAAVLEYRATGGGLPIPGAARFTTGLALIGAGIAVRLWAVRTLGARITGTPEAASGSRVVRQGPYAHVRQPSHSGALLVTLGMVLVLGSAVGLAVLACAVLPAYRHRVRVEERALMRDLGAPYVAYRECVPAFVPKPLGRTLPDPR